MDIWNWVEKLQGDLRQAGQAQNAHLLNRLADEVSELQIDRVDALLPEARALGKALDNPWVDVYVGHWALRNRVGNRVEGESALGEAVSLFERAHREDTLECPQSICVTQDLAACYGNIDGPGWVPERIEVCDETLGRIDPSWACFQCLSCEKADALLDDGRGQEALDYLQAQADAVEACGKEVFDSFPEMQIKILLAVGRADEALAWGLANRVVPDGTSREEAERLGLEISKFPQTCMRGDRLSAHEQFALSLEEALENEFFYGAKTVLSGETFEGALRFAGGAGRHGEFE